MQHMHMHMQGMWIAFGIAAVFIVYFVTRVTRDLARREAELARARAAALRSEKLASLATLAAGAAHELATPLSTIAVVARELERSLERAGALNEAVADARLIRNEVSRCRGILEQLAADAGASAGEGLAELSLHGLLDKASEGLAQRERIRCAIASGAEHAQLLVPARAVAQAVRGVLENALQASPPEAERGRAREPRGGCAARSWSRTRAPACRPTCCRARASRSSPPRSRGRAWASACSSRASCSSASAARSRSIRGRGRARASS